MSLPNFITVDDLLPRAELSDEFFNSPEAEFIIDPTNRIEVTEAVRTFLIRNNLPIEHIAWLPKDYKNRI